MTIWYCVECGDYYFSEPVTEKSGKGNLWVCPSCGTLSVLDINGQNRDLKKFVGALSEEFPSLRFDDSRPQYRPLNHLIEALTMGKHFIHVVTESIDKFFLGMLALKFYEKDIEIHILVWHPNKLYEDLSKLWKHSVLLKGYERGNRPFTRGIQIKTVSKAHQKMVIIDGQIAFKGSANATLDGWTEQGNIIEFSTDLNDIQILNRNYFSKYVLKKIKPQNK